MMKRNIIFLLVIMLLALVFISQTYRFKPRSDAPPAVLSALDSLANKALGNLEVPVGAVLVYGDSIIGVGFNTIVRDTLLSGHAEINALNDAHKKLRPVWSQLDRSRLIMYSTYEPCEMCKGAMMNMHISHVVFEGPKPFGDQVKTTLKSWAFDFNKRRFYAPGMQEKLFQRHPNYPKNR